MASWETVVEVLHTKPGDTLLNVSSIRKCILFAHQEVKMWKIAVLVLVGLALVSVSADVLAGHIDFELLPPGLLPSITSNQPAPSFRI